MRFFLLVLATAVLGSACKKDAALSNTTNHLEPGGAVALPQSPPAAAAVVLQKSVPQNDATRGVTARGLPSSVVPVTPGAAADPETMRSSEPVPIEDRNGEPMDDVDDEVVPATDKSGVDVANAEAEEGHAGRLDEDPEGADIDVRE